VWGYPFLSTGTVNLLEQLANADVNKSTRKNLNNAESRHHCVKDAPAALPLQFLSFKDKKIKIHPVRVTSLT